MYEYVLVIFITRNTTISYLGRRQRARNKLDESKEAMLSEDDNNQGLARLNFVSLRQKFALFALHMICLCKKGRLIYPTTNLSTGISNNSFLCCVFYFSVNRKELTSYFDLSSTIVQFLTRSVKLD